jgi:hypothetical protein
MVVTPFVDWTDDDIWAYIKKYDLPYDRRRYDERDETTSPDKYPTCFECLDAHHRGELVSCPKTQALIPNIARSADEHEALRQTLIGQMRYCEVTGEPRSTENSAHL